MKKKILALLLASAMTAGLVGCGGAEAGSTATSNGTSAASTEASGDVASGADLKVMIETPVESLDQQIAQDGTSFEVLACLVDGLTQMDADGQAIPAIAESWDIEDDGTTYVFHLRDAKWANGDPVTAQDFVFGWQRAVDPEVASEYSYMLSDIGQVVNAEAIIAGEMDKSELGVEAVDEKTLKVSLNVPVSYFLSLMYFPTYYPVNEKFFTECGDVYATSPDTLLSNGAFIMDEYEPAATAFHLTKNADYWDADRVQLSGLSYQVIQDSQQALMSYQAGDLDTTLVNGEQVEQVQDDPEFLTIAAGYLWYVAPNIRDVEALGNLNIRYALTNAINRVAIAQDVLKDGSKPTYTAVPMEFAAGPDGSDYAADQTRYAEFCADDTDKALECWNAGLQELGITELTLTMEVDADDAPQKVATVLKEQWETTLPGLTVELVVEPKKERIAKMQEGTFELGLTRWGPDYADPMTYLGMWVTGCSNNYGNWENPEFDAIIDECTTGSLCTDPKARWSALYDAEKVAMEDAVIFPLYTQANAEMLSSSVTGIEYHAVALNRVYKNCVKE